MNNLSGQLSAPCRGKPPAVPVGYVRSEFDPFLFNPVIYPCPDRTTKIIRRKCCGGDRTIVSCLRFKTRVHGGICKKCQDEEQEIA